LSEHSEEIEKSKTTKAIDHLLKPYTPTTEPKPEEPKWRMPGAKSVARNLQRRANKRLAKLTEKPKPETGGINGALQDWNKSVDEKGLRGNQHNAAPVVAGVDILQRIAEEMTGRSKPKRRTREVFK